MVADALLEGSGFIDLCIIQLFLCGGVACCQSFVIMDLTMVTIYLDTHNRFKWFWITLCNTFAYNISGRGMVMIVSNMTSRVIDYDCVLQLSSLLRHPNLPTLILSFYAKGELWNTWLDYLGAFRVKVDLFSFSIFSSDRACNCHQPVSSLHSFLVYC